MDMLEILSFVSIAALLVLSPGTNGVLIAKTVPVSGKSAGFANIAGFVAAFYIHGALSILGISILLVQSAQAFFIFKMFGAAYLFWVGLKSLLSMWKKKESTERLVVGGGKRRTLRGAFIEGLLTNVLNPKVSLFYLAAFPQFIPASSEPSSAFFLVFLHSMINLVWFATMVMVLDRLKMLVKGATFTQWLKGITGAAFMGLAVKLALLKPQGNS